MGNFILWNAATTDAGRTLSFSVLATAIKQLGRGTKEMIEHMLGDLGVPEVAFESWRVSHFVTSYLADDEDDAFDEEEGDPDAWQDIWSNHWRVDVRLAAPLAWTWSDFELVHSSATDESWTGDEPEPPLACVVVADFLEPRARERAAALLHWIEAQRAGAPRSELPDASDLLEPELLAALEPAELAAWPDARIGLETRELDPPRLLVSLGRFAPDFFESGAPLAERVRSLCSALGGLTRWSELADTRL